MGLIVNLGKITLQQIKKIIFKYRTLKNQLNDKDNYNNDYNKIKQISFPTDSITRATRVGDEDEGLRGLIGDRGPFWRPLTRIREEEESSDSAISSDDDDDGSIGDDSLEEFRRRLLRLPRVPSEDIYYTASERSIPSITNDTSVPSIITDDNSSRPSITDDNSSIRSRPSITDDDDIDYDGYLPNSIEPGIATRFFRAFIRKRLPGPPSVVSSEENSVTPPLNPEPNLVEPLSNVQPSNRFNTNGVPILGYPPIGYRSALDDSTSTISSLASTTPIPNEFQNDNESTKIFPDLAAYQNQLIQDDQTPINLDAVSSLNDEGEAQVPQTSTIFPKLNLDALVDEQLNKFMSSYKPAPKFPNSPADNQITPLPPKGPGSILYDPNLYDHMTKKIEFNDDIINQMGGELNILSDDDLSDSEVRPIVTPSAPPYEEPDAATSKDPNIDKQDTILVSELNDLSDKNISSTIKTELDNNELDIDPDDEEILKRYQRSFPKDYMWKTELMFLIRSVNKISQEAEQELRLKFNRGEQFDQNEFLQTNVKEILQTIHYHQPFAKDPQTEGYRQTVLQKASVKQGRIHTAFVYNEKVDELLNAIANGYTYWSKIRSTKYPNASLDLYLNKWLTELKNAKDTLFIHSDELENNLDNSFRANELYMQWARQRILEGYRSEKYGWGIKYKPSDYNNRKIKFGYGLTSDEIQRVEPNFDALRTVNQLLSKMKRPPVETNEAAIRIIQRLIQKNENSKWSSHLNYLLEQLQQNQTVNKPNESNLRLDEMTDNQSRNKHIINTSHITLEPPRVPESQEVMRLRNDVAHALSTIVSDEFINKITNNNKSTSRIVIEKLTSAITSKAGLAVILGMLTHHYVTNHLQQFIYSAVKSIRSTPETNLLFSLGVSNAITPFTPVGYIAQETLNTVMIKDLVLREIERNNDQLEKITGISTTELLYIGANKVIEAIKNYANAKPIIPEIGYEKYPQITHEIEKSNTNTNSEVSPYFNEPSYIDKLGHVTHGAFTVAKDLINIMFNDDDNLSMDWSVQDPDDSFYGEGIGGVLSYAGYVKQKEINDNHTNIINTLFSNKPYPQRTNNPNNTKLGDELPILNYNKNYVSAKDVGKNEGNKVLNTETIAPIITDPVTAISDCAIQRYTDSMGNNLDSSLPYLTKEYVNQPIIVNRRLIDDEYLRKRIIQDTNNMLRYRKLPLQDKIDTVNDIRATTGLIEMLGAPYMRHWPDVFRRLFLLRGIVPPAGRELLHHEDAPLAPLIDRRRPRIRPPFAEPRVMGHGIKSKSNNLLSYKLSKYRREGRKFGLGAHEIYKHLIIPTKINHRNIISNLALHSLYKKPHKMILKGEGIKCEHCNGRNNLSLYSNNKSRGYLCNECIHGKGMTKKREPLEDYELNEINETNPKTKDYANQLAEYNYHESLKNMDWKNSWEIFNDTVPATISKNFGEFSSKNFVASGEWSDYQLDILTYLIGYVTHHVDSKRKLPEQLLYNLFALTGKLWKAKGTKGNDFDYQALNSFQDLKEFIKLNPGSLSELHYIK